MSTAMRFVCGFLIGIVTMSTTVYAISEDDREAILNNTIYYDADAFQATCGATNGALVVNTSGLPTQAINQIEAIRSIVESNKIFYEQVANQKGLPWQSLAALHYRESSLSRINPNNMEGLFGFNSLRKAGYSFPPGPVNDQEFIYQLGLAADWLIKNSAEAYYSLTIADVTTAEYFPYAFLAYNRGARYKNAKLAIGREMMPEESPYVVNQLDSAHIDMYWPDGGETPLSWGEPSDTRNRGPHKMVGAVPFMIAFGYTPGISINSATCAVGVGVNGFIFPLATTKDVIDIGSYYPASGGVRWCKANCHNSPPAWAPYLAHDIGAPKFTTPVVASAGGIIASISVGTQQMSLWVLSDEGLWYFYQHNDPDYIVVNEGQRVEAGQEIARVGPYALNANSGSNTPPHLHYSVSTKRIYSMKRGCTQSECPDMDGFVDVLDPLLSSYQALPTGSPGANGR